MACRGQGVAEQGKLALELKADLAVAAGDEDIHWRNPFHTRRKLVQVAPLHAAFVPGRRRGCANAYAALRKTQGKRMKNRPTTGLVALYQ